MIRKLSEPHGMLTRSHDVSREYTAVYEKKDAGTLPSSKKFLG